MDILLRRSGGQNVVLRPQARAPWLPPAEVDAHEVEVRWQEVNPDGSLIGEPISLGRMAPTARPAIPHNPDSDRNVRVYVMPFAADGTPGYPSWRDAPQTTLIFQRVTEAPALSQVGAATADLIVVAVDPPERYVRRRRTRIADNALMTDASVTERDFGGEEVPRLVEIARTAGIVAAFTWTGNDPAANGFTKVGAGTTAASSSPAGWKITTSASDAATYYTKNAWPAGAFAAGFTLEVAPPVVNASDGAALPADSVLVRVEDGAKRYELRFSATGVYMNGGAAHAHAGAKVRLVVAVGGAVADLWVGDTKVENDTAGLVTATSGLSFGDLAGADDSEAVWPRIEYALTPQDVRLAETVYVAVSHSSGGAFGAESAVASFTFASEGGAGGSSGAGDLVYRDKYDINP